MRIYLLPAEIRNQIYFDPLTESDGQSMPISMGSLVGFSKVDVSALPFVPGRREVPLLYASAAVRREACDIWLNKQNFLFQNKDDIWRLDALLGALCGLLRLHMVVWK